jgi:uncharacterized membrane protein
MVIVPSGMGMGKKGAIILVILIVATMHAYAQNVTKPQRVFSGSATINMGRYEDYYLRIVTPESTIGLSPGETREIKFFLRRGDETEPIHDIQVLDDDPVFDIYFTPEIVPTLRNVDMVAMKAKVTAPSDLEEGLYPLKIKVRGKEFVEQRYPLNTQVKVGEHSNIVRYLALCTTLACIGLVYWRAYKLKK